MPEIFAGSVLACLPDSTLRVYFRVHAVRTYKTMSELKLRKVGNSLALTVPVHMAARMKVAEGDSLYLTELPG